MPPPSPYYWHQAGIPPYRIASSPSSSVLPPLPLLYRDTWSVSVSSYFSNFPPPSPIIRLAVFFRNNHFSVLFKHSGTGELYLLVTDQGYLTEGEGGWAEKVL